MDPYKFLNISLNPDGSLTRSPTVPLAPAAPSGELLPGSGATVLSKDVPLDPSRGTWIRLFLPSPSSSDAAPEKLPLIIDFHGGGFILFSAATKPFHDFCARIAAGVPALVASVEYRLAPEHRLPAAFDDATDALRWARAAADPWVRGHADLARCFIMGSSAGGTIAYHAARRAIASDLDLGPLRIAGLVLNQPYFGGKERTESELQMANDKVVPLAANDLMWEFALPEGADRGHEYSDPAAGERGLVGRLPPCLVRGYTGDPLVDRQKMLAEMLQRDGVQVVVKLDIEGYHGIELFDPEKADLLVADVKSFVCRRGGGGAAPDVGGGPRL